jgi:hypothetical protein
MFSLEKWTPLLQRRFPIWRVSAWQQAFSDMARSA